ncbi:MAG: RNA polymerase sigma-70 factor [Bacteroidales bacterium]|jgi:RNA polymerase sigma-70 factor (ECF subfamily)|nr:RNA polymerase sigma-70 factor [Bacteroidales bacterium]MCI1786250.1 RNA polymerase sigma-70 factor [Bacteroidales bacterium]
MDDNEQRFIRRLKKGDEKAYRELFADHYAVLCQYADGYLSDSFQAEAIAGDVIFHIWEIRKTLDIKVSLRSYLMRAVRNRCINYLKQTQLKKECSLDLHCCDDKDDGNLFSGELPVGKLLERELEQEIKQAVDSLPEESRRVFVKSRCENKQYKEIAAELDISVNTVKYHIKKALSLLSGYLDKYFV